MLLLDVLLDVQTSHHYFERVAGKQVKNDEKKGRKCCFVAKSGACFSESPITARQAAEDVLIGLPAA